MNSKEIVFIPIGGGQRVGSSCYYLRLGNSNIILDAGTSPYNGNLSEPDTLFLKTSPFIESMSQIDKIFISHAHIDHVGYLIELAKQAINADIYMTELTLLLTKHQFYSNYRKKYTDDDEELSLIESILDRVVTVSYHESFDFGGYKVSFYQAGHIPGAMMTCFEYRKKRILYTGDFSVSDTPLAEKCVIPEGIDKVIMCGLHAKHPHYKRNKDTIFQTMDYILSLPPRGKSVVCRVNQLSKGVEFLKYLEEKNTMGISIYMDRNLTELVEKFEKLNIKMITSDVHVDSSRKYKEPHIFITSDGKTDGLYYDSLNIDFSIHEDFQEMKEFIKKLNPRDVYLVHCDSERYENSHTIEQELVYDGECRSQFTFAEENEIYIL